uniref:ketoacyl-synthetase C-terminal extension domain-containing protein n=1 Tax=Streptomyces sp. bgisy032 TaxID=3413773 RepID=UPI003D725E79
LTEARPWPVTDRPRRAGVSSFGVSGTNAHVILEQAPEGAADDEPRASDVPGLLPWVVSARGQDALRAQAGRLAPLAAEPAEFGTGLLDVGHSLAVTRAALTDRAVILAADRDELLAGLDALHRGRDAHNVVTGRDEGRSHTVFLFTGQGSQRAGCGRELYERFPVFAAAVGE